MKILILCPSLNNTPFGKVSFDIVYGLIKNGHEVVLITSKSNLQEVKYLFETGYGYVFPDKISKIISIFGRFNIKFYFFGKRIIKSFRRNNIKELFKPDIIYALCSRDFDILMNVAMTISIECKIPYAIHLVDPIPPPKGWETYEIYRRSLVRLVKKPISRCNYFSMNNERMLKYQQENLGFNIENKSFVVPDPVADDFKWYGMNKSNEKKIVYLGSFYSARMPHSLIKGFALFAAQEKSYQLHIIGNNKINLDNYEIADSARSRIKILSWTLDVDEIIKNTDLLVDVDADIEGDVFVSSKIKNYLNSDRVIMSITRNNSPTFDLLSPLKKSVYITSHNPEDIRIAISSALSVEYSDTLFSERLLLLDRIKISVVVGGLETSFDRIIKNYNKEI